MSARTLFFCRDCELVFAAAREHLSADEQKQRYLQHRNTRDDAGYVAHLRGAVAAACKHLPRGSRVLDYGSGPSAVLGDLLAEQGFVASRYDPIFEPDGPAGEVDGVLSVETFEHFALPGEEIGRIVARLRPGGVLVVKTLLHSGPGSFEDWWYARDRTHVSFFGLRTFEAMSGAFGLELVESDRRRLVVLRRGEAPAEPRVE